MSEDDADGPEGAEPGHGDYPVDAAVIGFVVGVAAALVALVALAMSGTLPAAPADIALVLGAGGLVGAALGCLGSLDRRWGFERPCAECGRDVWARRAPGAGRGQALCARCRGVR
ncbi:MAG TPA: hypothetical protein VNT51_13775 [Miltoncostaeaceae bacterium]|nr:hypothetical protein [Miltoncostaeaceae bacterium]